MACRQSAVFLTLAVLFGLPIIAGAQEGLEPVPEPPPIPEAVRSGETLEPDIRIVRGESETVTEYRVNGVVRAIKVQPDVGPAYYLIDTDGDGRIDNSTELGPEVVIPQWVLFSW